MSGKAEIRRAALERRDALPLSLRRDCSRAIADRIVAMREFRDAKVVMAYCSFGSEIDTSPILRCILACGKTLVLPRVNRAGGHLEIFQVGNLETDLRPGVWGIPEPDADQCPARRIEALELIVVPGVSFDREGGRIGHGKGYYDKFLNSCRESGSYPQTVSGAFEAQVVNSIPMEVHDVRIETLVTEAGAWGKADAKAAPRNLPES